MESRIKYYTPSKKTYKVSLISTVPGHDLHKHMFQKFNFRRFSRVDAVVFWLKEIPWYHFWSSDQEVLIVRWHFHDARVGQTWAEEWWQAGWNAAKWQPNPEEEATEDYSSDNETAYDGEGFLEEGCGLGNQLLTQVLIF